MEPGILVSVVANAPGLSFDPPVTSHRLRFYFPDIFDPSVSGELSNVAD